MTIELPTPLENELRSLSGACGKDVGMLVQEAIRQYLDAASITDLDAQDVGATQASLAQELRGIPEWTEEDCSPK